MKLKIKCSVSLLVFIALIFCGTSLKGQPITTGTLLEEMADLKRLSEMPEHPYKCIQFSSYDRRSRNISEPGWFANSDGFGKEPVPGFEKVLKASGEDGIGEYLICDVKGSGAILRLWTARISGKIRLYLDGSNIPVYEGDAQSFFRETAEQLSEGAVSTGMGKALRQSDATYFPIPFARRCRIEWTGDIKKLHFYHIGIRLYEPPCEVVTFSPEDVARYMPELEKICKVMDASGKGLDFSKKGAGTIETTIPQNSQKELFSEKGSRAIEYFSLKVDGDDLNKILRQNILNIYFDGSPTPQVQSPIGDFFGAAPGVNPYQSVPFSVYPDGTMECRFFMPFKDSVRIEVENASDQDIHLTGSIKAIPYQWEEGQSMYFRAKWRINHDLTASGINVIDIPYLLAIGQGRVVGAATYLLNPSNAPKSYGNWWGEGDEKIFVDRDTFPSFFGTGSEDYYNYSWSSPAIFSYPYSGQPRNDGPGNRGFACNYRWHIPDDIPFYDRLAFYMELFHHGEVPGFAYGRMVYLYSLPGLLDDHMPVSKDDIREQNLSGWDPVAYKGSAGYRFYNAEELVSSHADVYTEEGLLWAGGKILMWAPSGKGDKISFSIPNNFKGDENKMVITFAHLPESGKVSVYVNGNLTKFKNQNVLNLYEPYHKVLRNYTSVPLSLKKDNNDVTIEYIGEAKDKKVGIDFIWIKE